MRFSGEVTVASGTPVQINTIHLMATRIIIQAPPGSAEGEIYVFLNVPAGVTPSTGTFPYITLAPAGTNSPSDTFEDSVDFGDGGFFDTSRIWIDGSHTGDVVNFSFNAKV